MSARVRPRTSQRRSPPNTMANTIARSRWVRSAAMQRVDLGWGEDLRERARHPHQRHLLAASAPPAGREPPRHRVRAHRRVTTSDQVRVEARDRRQAPGDRAGRQPRLAVADPHHRAVAALMGEEVEHICGHDLGRVLVDHTEEGLQVMRDRPKRVRPGPARHERQVRVDQRITQFETGLTTARRGPDQARKGAHPCMILAASEIHGDTRWITRVLGVQGRVHMHDLYGTDGVRNQRRAGIVRHAVLH